MIEGILINGTILGAIYALLALGFTLIYGVAGVVNLAHGAFFMLGAFMFYALGPLGPIPALILAAVIVGAIASLVYRLALHPVRGDDVAIMVVTVGLALIVQQLVLMVFGYSVGLTPFVEGWTTIWGVRVTYETLLASALSASLFFILQILITKSQVGKAMRAVSQDHEAAMLMGVNTERVYMLTMGISAAFAALAGVFIASALLGGQAQPHMWLHPLFASFSIVILGGLGSIKGTFIGGFIIAYAERFVANLAPQGGRIVTAVPIVIMVLIILIKPKGLFGKRIEME